MESGARSSRRANNKLRRVLAATIKSAAGIGAVLASLIGLVAAAAVGCLVAKRRREAQEQPNNAAYEPSGLNGASEDTTASAPLKAADHEQGSVRDSRQKLAPAVCDV